MVFRAVYPKGSKIAPSNAKSRIEKPDRCPVSASIGKATTERAESRSATMLTALLPNRAIRTPPNGATRREGIADTATTKPAKAGESVTSRVIQGIVIITTEFEIPEKKFET
jgi:hypothetical protein